jgi:hypothetical protein
MLAALTFNQIMIAVCGLTALVLLTFGNQTSRMIAPVFGLAGQPFWVMSALDSHQLGVLVVTLAYTLVWIGSALRTVCVLRARAVSPNARPTGWGK